MADIRLPSLDQYNSAVQHPQTVFTDAELQRGEVLKNGMGLPIPFSGGFALTYKFTCGTREYAVRVFHKRSDRLQDRYTLISTALQRLRSSYFINFAYHARGIRIENNVFPVVKMDWVEGDTFGNYLEGNFANGAKMSALRVEFQKVGTFLAANGIAHGDLQTGNAMVGGGCSLKLIDYDGMYVPEMTETRSPEMGHRHFQHPGRTESTFGPTIDRFSLILIDLSLELVAAKPALFRKYGNTGENIIFTATDFRDPASSPLFQELYNDPAYKPKVSRFAALCKSPFAAIPTPEDFSTGKWTSNLTITFQPGKPLPAPQEAAYVGAYDVFDATDYRSVLGQVGNRIELIGKIFEVHQAFTTRRPKRPYVFINFGRWQGEMVKIAIWSPLLGSLSPKPAPSWAGKWVSVTGLVDPPFKKAYSGSASYSHLSITLSSQNQLSIIDETTARFRLKKAGARVSGRSSNADVLAALGKGNGAAGHVTASTSNRQIVANLRGTGSQLPSPAHPGQSSPTPTPRKKNEWASCLGYVILIAFILLLMRACSGHG